MPQMKCPIRLRRKLAANRRSKLNSDPLYCTVLTCLLEPASPREKHGDVSWVVSTPRFPVVALLHLLDLQPKPVRFESADNGGYVVEYHLYSLAQWIYFEG